MVCSRPWATIPFANDSWMYTTVPSTASMVIFVAHEKTCSYPCREMVYPTSATVSKQCTLSASINTFLFHDCTSIRQTAQASITFFSHCTSPVFAPNMWPTIYSACNVGEIIHSSEATIEHVCWFQLTPTPTAVGAQIYQLIPPRDIQKSTRHNNDLTIYSILYGSSCGGSLKVERLHYQLNILATGAISV